jgi:hypothetical protein
MLALLGVGGDFADGPGRNIPRFEKVDKSDCKGVTGWYCQSDVEVA